MPGISLQFPYHPEWPVSEHRYMLVPILSQTCQYTVITYNFVANRYQILIFVNLTLLFTDVSTTMIVKPGPVMDFLLANQKVEHPNQIDWQKVSFFFCLFNLASSKLLLDFYYGFTCKLFDTFSGKAYAQKSQNQSASF